MLKLKTKSPKYEQSEKKNFWNFKLGWENYRIILFKKFMLAKNKVILFRVQSKYAQSRVLYSINVRIEEQDSEVQNKWKSITWYLDLGQKLIFLMHACAIGGTFFGDLHKYTQRRLLQVSQ